jgi:hypothetical protein
MLSDLYKIVTGKVNDESLNEILNEYFKRRYCRDCAPIVKQDLLFECLKVAWRVTAARDDFKRFREDLMMEAWIITGPWMERHLNGGRNEPFPFKYSSIFTFYKHAFSKIINRNHAYCFKPRIYGRNGQETLGAEFVVSYGNLTDMERLRQG